MCSNVVLSRSFKLDTRQLTLWLPHKPLCAYPFQVLFVNLLPTAPLTTPQVACVDMRTLRIEMTVGGREAELYLLLLPVPS